MEIFFKYRRFNLLKAFVLEIRLFTELENLYRGSIIKEVDSLKMLRLQCWFNVLLRILIELKEIFFCKFANSLFYIMKFLR